MTPSSRAWAWVPPSRITYVFRRDNAEINSGSVSWWNALWTVLGFFEWGSLDIMFGLGFRILRKLYKKPWIRNYRRKLEIMVSSTIGAEAARGYCFREGRWIRLIFIEPMTFL
jgi:hypothetical protein